MICFPLPAGPLAPSGDVLRGWRITSWFGPRAGGNHGGLDLAYPGCAGRPIYAPVAGVVSQGWDSSGGGNWTGLHGEDGAYWGMGHAAGFAEGVNGRRVCAGETLAYVGSTGHSSGPHLHFALRPPGAGAYRDPLGELQMAQYDAGVKMTQELLAGLGFDVGVADGVYGTRTHDAVIAFQQAHGLMTDGIIGPEVNGELAALYAPLVGKRIDVAGLHGGLDAARAALDIIGRALG